MARKQLTEQQILIGKRRKARHYAMQALYQWAMTGNPVNHIEAQFRMDNDFSRVDTEYFSRILHDAPAELDVLDECITRHLTDRELKDVNPVELAILRLSVFELKNRPDTPYKVVINEAVSLAKKFGAQDSHKFINAILDKAAGEFRQPERAIKSR